MTSIVITSVWHKSKVSTRPIKIPEYRRKLQHRVTFIPAHNYERWSRSLFCKSFCSMIKELACSNYHYNTLQSNILLIGRYILSIAASVITFPSLSPGPFWSILPQYKQAVNLIKSIRDNKVDEVSESLIAGSFVDTTKVLRFLSTLSPTKTILFASAHLITLSLGGINHTVFFYRIMRPLQHFDLSLYN